MNRLMVPVHFFLRVVLISLILFIGVFGGNSVFAQQIDQVKVSSSYGALPKTTLSKTTSLLSVKKTAIDPLIRYQTYYAKHNILAAQAMIQGKGKKVTIAVIDSMIDITHDDLHHTIWRNTKEIAGNGKDDDANSLIDDVYGWNFSAQKPLGEIGVHATMVAGIIGASQQNGTGIRGIAKNVALMPLGIYDDTDTDKGFDGYLKFAIHYAIEKKADIINISMGALEKTSMATRIIKEAQDKGIIIVIAAGNEGVDTTYNSVIPLSLEKTREQIIGVGALTAKGVYTDWSNTGLFVDTAALGEGVYSTQPGNTYGSDDGTSFSAPIITGIIALGYNKYGAMPAKTVYDALQQSVGKNGFLDAVLYLRALETLRKK